MQGKYIIYVIMRILTTENSDFFSHWHVSDFLNRRGKQKNHLGTEPMVSQLVLAYPGLICPSM